MDKSATPQPPSAPEDGRTPVGWQPIASAPVGKLIVLSNDAGWMALGDWRQYRVYNAPKFTKWLDVPSPLAGPEDTPPAQEPKV